MGLFLVAGCAVPLGPGYTIERQSVELHVVLSPKPHIAVHAEYTLANTGNRPLDRLRVDLPAYGHRDATSFQWNGQTQLFEEVPSFTPSNAGDAVELRWQEPWQLGQKPVLTLDYNLAPGTMGRSSLAASPNLFFVQSGIWSPTLLPPNGLFSKGGTPPKKWRFSVRVPENFVVETGSHPRKRRKEGQEWVHEFRLSSRDSAPFAAGGNYTAQESRAEGWSIHFWTLHPLDSSFSRAVAAAVAARAKFFESEYGPPPSRSRDFYILECEDECSEPEYAFLPGIVLVQSRFFAEESNPDRFATRVNLLLAYSRFALAPAVDLDPGELPMRETLRYIAEDADLQGAGADARPRLIRRVLDGYDGKFGARPCHEKVSLPFLSKHPGCAFLYGFPKSELLFFALEDELGREKLHRALKTLFQSRHGGDPTLADLIAAVDAETHQPQGEFIRKWLKHPGIPEEFRARYSMVAAPAESASPDSQSGSPKESHP